jgi:hypothetical protein
VSNSLAIAAATRTLLSLLSGVTPNVTALPPDKARDNLAADQLNLFLYQTQISAAWRNADPPRQVRSGETGLPALPLTLHYLVTAFGVDEARAHEVLGTAMSILHDHPVLGAKEIQDANAADLPAADLHLQAERIRITPLALPTDELFKLWSGFQTNYRLSAAYELSVVLIDSRRPALTPLPVLRQGPDDRGPVATAGSAPSLTGVVPPLGDPVAVLGSRVLLQGANLGGPVSAARFVSPRLDAPIDLVPEVGTSSERVVALPSGSPAIADWAPGMHTVSLVTSLPGVPTWLSNEIPFGLGATITVAPLAASPGPLTLTVTCAPRLRAGQRALLLFGTRQAAPTTVVTPADPTLPSTLTFDLTGVATGTYLVRLRVDGVDSNPVVRTGTPPKPAFDANQQVVVS